MASERSAWIMSDRRPATGPARSLLIRHAMLAGSKNPSSAGSARVLLACAGAGRSTGCDLSA
jgi:hypothetical protein